MTCYFQLMNIIMRLNAESSSRPLTPSPLREGGGGVAKHTKVVCSKLSAASVLGGEAGISNRSSFAFSEQKVISAPPPLLRGGEGVWGREGTFGFKPQRG